MANISLSPGVEFYYVGGDYIEGSITNSNVETEIMFYVIPPDVVLHGIHVEAFIRVANTTGATAFSIVRIIVDYGGASPTAVISPKMAVSPTLDNEYSWLKATIQYPDWTQAQRISITAQNDIISVGFGVYAYALIINGW